MVKPYFIKHMTKDKIKILIVDDHDSTRETYCEVFRNFNFDVLAARDGVEGLDIASRENPDVIFTGIIMPRMDGFAMMEALKKNVATASIPVVISSHMGREEDRRKADQVGARDFIIRDMTPPNEVVERVRSIFTGENEYCLEINSDALDAQKLAQELNIEESYRCKKCGTKMIILISGKTQMDNTFSKVRITCPKCEK